MSPYRQKKILMKYIDSVNAASGLTARVSALARAGAVASAEPCLAGCIDEVVALETNAAIQAELRHLKAAIQHSEQLTQYAVFRTVLHAQERAALLRSQ